MFVGSERIEYNVKDKMYRKKKNVEKIEWVCGTSHCASMLTRTSNHVLNWCDSCSCDIMIHKSKKFKYKQKNQDTCFNFYSSKRSTEEFKVKLPRSSIIRDSLPSLEFSRHYRPTGSKHFLSRDIRTRVEFKRFWIIFFQWLLIVDYNFLTIGT